MVPCGKTGSSATGCRTVSRAPVVAVSTGMNRDEVRSAMGEPERVFHSETGLMDVWIYRDHYVGFDSTGTVVKTGTLAMR